MSKSVETSAHVGRCCNRGNRFHVGMGHPSAKMARALTIVPENETGAILFPNFLIDPKYAIVTTGTASQNGISYFPAVRTWPLLLLVILYSRFLLGIMQILPTKKASNGHRTTHCERSCRRKLFKRNGLWMPRVKNSNYGTILALNSSYAS